MKYVLIKLFIGIVLFGTLVAMRILNIVDQDIKALCMGGLLGLGIMHLGGEVSKADKDGGYASPLALLVLALLGISLAACASHTTQNAQVTYTQSCAAYGGAFNVMVALRKADKLTQPQINQVTLIDSQITPLCTGPLPADLDAATQQVTAAVTALTILETIK
jgi:hypothetical protein